MIDLEKGKERSYTMEHKLKILPEYFEAIQNGTKRFEIRKDDRDFQVGDCIHLHEWDGEKFTGRFLNNIRIKYILRNCPEHGLKEGYCVLGL